MYSFRYTCNPPFVFKESRTQSMEIVCQADATWSPLEECERELWKRELHISGLTFERSRMFIYLFLWCVSLFCIVGVACDPPPPKEGYEVEMPFRVGHGEFASYKCPTGQYFQSKPTARPEFKVTCKHNFTDDKCKYYYFENDTVEFDPDKHDWETCTEGNSGLLVWMATILPFVSFSF